MTARKPKNSLPEPEAEPTEAPAPASGGGASVEGDDKEDDDAAFEAELVDASEVPDAPLDDAALARAVVREPHARTAGDSA